MVFVFKIDAKHSILLRSGDANDLPSVKKLQGEIFPTAYSQQFYDDLLKSDAVFMVVDLITDEIANNGSSIIGVATGKCKKEREENSLVTENKLMMKFHRSGPFGYIMTLGIHASYRNMGIGQMLLRSLVDELIDRFGCKEISLHVITSNTAAVRLYQRSGFRMLGRSRMHYRIHGEYFDAWEMILSNRFPFCCHRICLMATWRYCSSKMTQCIPCKFTRNEATLQQELLLLNG